jgi:hypothetical protein
MAPEGVSFPFLVMEWVEGVPLYEWAKNQREVLDRRPRCDASMRRDLLRLEGRVLLACPGALASPHIGAAVGTSVDS